MVKLSNFFRTDEVEAMVVVPVPEMTPLWEKIYKIAGTSYGLNGDRFRIGMAAPEQNRFVATHRHLKRVVGDYKECIRALAATAEKDGFLDEEELAALIKLNMQSAVAANIGDIIGWEFDADSMYAKFERLYDAYVIECDAGNIVAAELIFECLVGLLTAKSW